MSFFTLIQYIMKMVRSSKPVCEIELFFYEPAHTSRIDVANKLSQSNV